MGVPDSAWAKLSRAKMHTDNLHAELSAFGGSGKPLYVVRREFDAELQCFIWRATEVRDLPIEWNLIIGDALTNARSALDHLAWHLVVAAGKSPTDEETRVIQFPIYNTEGGYRANLARRLPGVIDAGQLAVVQRYQPWTVAPNASEHPFALLASFGNVDRHRYIDPVEAFNAGEFHFSIIEESVRDFEITSPGLLLFGTRWDPDKGLLHFSPHLFYVEEGAELARVCGRVMGPNPNVDMDYSAATQVVFRDGQWSAEGTLNRIGTAVTALFYDIGPFL